MNSEKFRQQLRKEAEKWQAEGLIDGEVYAELSRRYRFDDLAKVARNRFVTILVMLGGIFLGLAIVILVSDRWQLWSKELKVLLLISLFAGTNSVGFYLWQHSLTQWQAQMGKGLLLLGALILGANLALMPQIFHQSGSVYQLFLVWGLGVLAMAYSLRLTSLGFLTIILLGIAYVSGILALWIPGQVSSFRLAIEHMPLLACLLGIPLAYWCHSRWLFGLTAILIIFSFEVNLIVFLANFLNYSPATRGIMSAIAYSLPPALLWAYRDSLWFISPRISCDFMSRNLGLFFLGGEFYLFSFNRFWLPFSYRTGSEIALHDWFKLLDIFLLAGLTLWAWWRLGYGDNLNARWRMALKNTIFGTAIVITALIVCWHFSIGALGAIATLIFNLFFLLLGIGLIREGFSIRKRKVFWLGIFLIALQLISRMLEYGLGLFFVAIVLIVCGIGSISAGFWFERYLDRLNTYQGTVNDE